MNGLSAVAASAQRPLLPLRWSRCPEGLEGYLLAGTMATLRLQQAAAPIPGGEQLQRAASAELHLPALQTRTRCVFVAHFKRGSTCPPM